jgi:amino acid adenylation domain-containing protein
MAAFLLHQLLAQSAQCHPDRPAIVDGDRVLTYQALDHWSDRVARALADRGVRPGDRVGVDLGKSAEAVVAIYGALKAGACYVPCDHTAPAARLAALAADCGMRAVCTSTARAGSWLRMAAGSTPVRRLLLLDGDQPDGDRPDSDRPDSDRPDSDDGRPAATGLSITAGREILAYPAGPPGVARSELDIAYLLYTSGSTGRPKGVMLTHRNGLSFVEWAAGELGVTSEDRLSSHAPFHFDLSVLDLFAAAAGGAATVLVPAAAMLFPPRLADFVRSSRITVWYSVPSVLSMLVRHGGLRPGDFPGLRAMLFAGEVLSARLLRDLMELLPHVRFGNLYGPTETNVCTAHWLSAPPDGGRDIPIGSDIANVETFLVEDGDLAGPGPAGELYVRGPTVARGYWGDPERTAERFVPDPRDRPVRDTVYRTGDLVRLLDDGSYLFLGRRDGQIKSRGYRIELGEIEAALRQHPGVLDVAVVAVAHDFGASIVKACAVTGPETKDHDLRRHCQTLLPRQMVPDIIEIRKELPRTSTGKIDRQSLARPADPGCGNGGAT